MKMLHLILITFLILSLVANSFAQDKEELTQKRTENSKTYSNGDGSYTTEISINYLHYKDKDGKYKEIKKDFIASNQPEYNYEITEGLFSFYAKDYSKQKKAYKFLTNSGHELNFDIVSMGYYNQKTKEYRPLEQINDIKVKITKNEALYKDIIKGVDLKYSYLGNRLKEEVSLSQNARDNLPDVATFGFDVENTYLMFKAEIDKSTDLQMFHDQTDISGQDYETTSRIAFKDGEGKVQFYFSNDLATFNPKKGDLENWEEYPVLKRIYTEDKKQYVLSGIPLKWLNNLSEGDVIIDPTVELNTPQTCQDAHVYKWDGDSTGTTNTNYGTSTVLYVGAWTKNTINTFYREYLQFDFSAIPANARISTANLNFTNDGNAHSGGNSSRYTISDTYLRRVTKPWNEYDITWAEQPATTDDNRVSIDAPDSAYKDFDEDVTTLVKDILNSDEGNNGFQLMLQNETKYRLVRYASTQNATSDWWPKLIITYTEIQEAYYLKDHLGNIRVTVDGNGDVVTADDYYPFGLQMPGRSYNIAMTSNLYKYSSKELDEESGLDWYSFGARYYDPVIGRFLSVDPFAHKYAGWNPYNYVGNNPLNLIDPTGETWVYVATSDTTGYHQWVDDSDAKSSSESNVVPVPVPVPLPLPLPITKDQYEAPGKLLLMLYEALTSSSSTTQTETEEENGTTIYRLGSGTATNLTPRKKDFSGLSYTTIQPEGLKFTQTTLEAVNATGSLKAVVDNPQTGHVSVLPAEYPASTTRMSQWIRSRPHAERNPHPLTTTLQSISIKSR